MGVLNEDQAREIRERRHQNFRARHRSYRALVLEHLRTRVGEEFTLDDLRVMFPDLRKPQLAPAVYHLRKKGHVEELARGRYRVLPGIENYRLVGQGQKAPAQDRDLIQRIVEGLTNDELIALQRTITDTLARRLG